MLSGCDAELVRRDPALPGLAMLLDADAFNERLRSAARGAGWASDTFAPAYVRYKPGTSCLVAYRGAAGGPPRLYAVARGPMSTGKLQKALGSTAGDPGSEACVLSREAVEIRSLRADPALRSLRRIQDDAARDRLMAERFSHLPDLQGAALTSLAYKPERRYVGRLDPALGPSAVLRLYSPEGYLKAIEAADAFRSATVLRVPAGLGRSDRHHALLFEWLPGASLREVSGPDPRLLGPYAEPIGAALAELHTQRTRHGSRLQRADDLLAIGPSVTAVAMLQPRLEALASGIGSRIAASLETMAAPIAPVHGDFYGDQVVVLPDAIGVVDFDRAHLGDPAVDLGLFIAHLERAALLSGPATDGAEAARDDMLRGYGLVTRGLHERVRLHVAAGLLRLAVDPFRNRASDWPLQMERVLLRAAEICRAATDFPAAVA
jgi:aminoglycoside phosphotransferase (APT) family kinase protein